MAVEASPSWSAAAPPMASIHPSFSRIWLITPTSGSSIHLKMIAVMSTDAAQGAMSAQRATLRSGKRWLNSCARASENSTVSTTTATTQITLRTMMSAKSFSPNSFS